MTKLKPYKIHNFELSMGEDLRGGNVANISHFDIKRNKLVPRRDTEDTSASTGDAFTLPAIQALVYAPFFTADWGIYGLGTDTNGKIYEKMNGGGGYSWSVDTTWDDPSGNDLGTATYESILFHYKNYLYGFQGGSHLFQYGDLTTGGNFNSGGSTTYQAISYTTTAQPVHHGEDDNAYFFANNIVYRLDDTTWDGAVLTLPDNKYITAGCEYGSYLAVGVSPVITNVANPDATPPMLPTDVFIWDRDSSLETITAKASLPEGKIIAMGELDSRLIVVVDENIASADSNDKGRLSIHEVNLGGSIELNAIESKQTTFTAINTTPNGKKLYFTAEVTNEVGAYGGIFSIDSSGRVTIEQVEEGATTPGDIQSILKVGDYWFHGHSDDGSLTRTSNTATYTFTSFLETGIYGDGFTTYKVTGISVGFESLPTAGSVTLKYKLPADTSWTSIGSESTDGALRMSFVDNLPQYKEIQFRIESTGGAVITGFKFDREIIKDDVYG